MTNIKKGSLGYYIFQKSATKKEVVLLLLLGEPTGLLQAKYEWAIGRVFNLTYHHEENWQLEAIKWLSDGMVVQPLDIARATQIVDLIRGS